VEYEGNFYLGRTYDLKNQKINDDQVLYDPDDLTTHGVVVGMTGSGKTGLCVDLLEEAALNGIPAILIDPKGDLANLLLHFPALEAEDFKPWIDKDQARREGKSIREIARDTATLWRDGLEKWGIPPERIVKVTDSVEYAVFTPGSDVGIPVNILSSLKAPEIEWEGNKENIREKISSTVTALLGLVGVDADPVQSREHILLSNVFEASWKDGQDFDLEELIRQIQNPPFEKLGAFELEQFYPSEDRFKLAMALNNLLASPSFQAWVEGTPLDIAKLLWNSDGKPRHSVFYLAHLPDSERMFFVTLLLTAVESWMRSEAGTSSLRAMLYIDEVLGFLPPVANPPSKPPLLRLLKQARAFGLGVLLTTQNPVDLDYKGLGNAGTWFVGKLQTEQDKARLLDGLESVVAGKGGFKRSKVSEIISSLQKRVFLLHNVHEKAPQIFHTRWAMAYLPGPISRPQIEKLNELVGANAPRPSTSTRAAAASELAPASQKYEDSESESISQTRPKAPRGVKEYFISNELTMSEALKEAGLSKSTYESKGALYRPALLAQADVRFIDRKSGIDTTSRIAYLELQPDRRGFVRWGELEPREDPVTTLDANPMVKARFADLGSPLNDAKMIKDIERDFIDYIYTSESITLPFNPKLKITATPDMTEEDFIQKCSEAAQEGQDEESEKLKDKYEAKLKRVQEKIKREGRELAEDEADHSARKLEEMATAAENILGLFTGSRSSRRVSSSMTKRRMTSTARADVQESLDAIGDFKEDLLEIAEELQDELEEIKDRWDDVATEIDEKVITPYKKDIHIDLFGLGWAPYWLIVLDGEDREIRAFK
jgi:hypothetical protein